MKFSLDIKAGNEENLPIKLQLLLRYCFSIFSMMLEYLEKFHSNQISQIVLADTIKDIAFRALPVDLSILKQNNIELFKLVSYRINIWNQQPKWTEALTEAQGRFIKANKNPDYTLLKENFPVCFQNYPEVFNVERIYNQVWQMVQVKGNVFRSKERGKMEMSREYKCRKCKNAKQIYADRITEFYFHVPDRCIITKDCKGTMFDTATSDKKEENMDHTNLIEYQEIKIQICDRPVASELVTVELQDEFVESCFVGDRVTICGTLEFRSVKGINEHRLVIRACSVIVEESQHKLNIDPIEMKFNIMCDWENDLRRLNGDETKIKDEMVGATAPELKDLATVKLGLLMVLCSGGKSAVTTEKIPAANKSITEREICHLLMVGDPGLGKSKILKAGAEISTNAVRTVGYAATTAGLAAHCIIEGGESHVEAGALVKANNGICCIDELNYLTKEHQGSIHEAMESQKISMSKGEFFFTS